MLKLRPIIQTYPTRGSEATLGTNPICMIAPASGDDNFCIDMATTTVALGKVEVNRRKGTDIPTGWAVDRNGASTNDAEECFVHGGLLPLGGLEENGGYKGFGLGLMVEILCGGLSGSKEGFLSNFWVWNLYQKRN